jgi:predicted CXXCH cytochrome family protein
MQRVRTTKERAKRIDLMYFVQAHWLRQWRFWLAVAVPALALVWFFTLRVQGGETAFSSGSLSRAHAVFTEKCSLCHVQQPGGFFENVTDQGCLTCHDAPAHHTSQTFTPTCASCHVEHKRKRLLRATADQVCTQCHADLKTRGGKTEFATTVEGFDHDHPEFATLRAGGKDPGGIKLNHSVHLQANLLGPNHTRVQLTCDDCHRPAGVEELWPYSGAPIALAPVATSTDTLRPRHARAYMAPPKFASHCAGCHMLDFDARFGSEQVPHDKISVVHAFLIRRYSEYIGAHPGDVRQVALSTRRMPGRPCTPRASRNAAEWVQFRVEETEWILWLKTCKECHTLMQGGTLLQDKSCETPNAAEQPLPEIAKANITTRWLPHATFDHQAHRMMKCDACHTKAPTSRETADVLIPGIKLCQECHRSAGPSKDFAEGRCFECHQYHNWKDEKRVKGPYELHQLRSGIAAPPLQQ